jgi:hypothetical protein
MPAIGLGRKATRSAGQTVPSLIDGMNIKGASALLPVGNFMQIVLEGDDAGVQALKTAREGGWAGQGWFEFDAEMTL